MVDIGRLVLALPSGFERRASRIARLTAESIAAECGRMTPASRTVDHIAVSAPPLQASWSDRRVARVLAGAVSAGIAARND